LLQFCFNFAFNFNLRHYIKVFVQASTSKLKEWRLRTMIARRAQSQGAGAG